jgi:hypothetical protein
MARNFARNLAFCLCFGKTVWRAPSQFSVRSQLADQLTQARLGGRFPKLCAVQARFSAVKKPKNGASPLANILSKKPK